MLELQYLCNDYTRFEVLIIPIFWFVREELGLGEIKQLAQSHIASWWPGMNLNACLTSKEEELSSCATRFHLPSQLHIETSC